MVHRGPRIRKGSNQEANSLEGYRGVFAEQGFKATQIRAPFERWNGRQEDSFRYDQLNRGILLRNVKRRIDYTGRVGTSVAILVRGRMGAKGFLRTEIVLIMVHLAVAARQKEHQQDHDGKDVLQFIHA